MGQAKRMQQYNEDLYFEARDLLVQAECIEECENHSGTFFEGNDPIEAAYKLANFQITNGSLSLPDGWTRRDYTDHVKSVYQDNCGDGCPECERNFGPE